MDSLKPNYDRILEASRKVKYLAQPFLSSHLVAQPSPMLSGRLTGNLGEIYELSLPKSTLQPLVTPRGKSQSSVSLEQQLDTVYRETYGRLCDKLARPVVYSTRLKMTSCSQLLCSQMRLHYQGKLERARCFAGEKFRQGSSGRQPLDQDIVQLLEAYYQNNTYPCSPERTKLATKCRMSIKQIDAWFQNRRNRMKKFHRNIRKLPLKRLSHYSSASTRPMSLCRPQYLTTDRIPESSETETPLDEESMNPLDCPPKALPLSHQQCSPSFSPSLWRRRAVDQGRISSSQEVDMEMLTCKLSKLNLRDPSNSRDGRKHTSWYAAWVTNLHTAPRSCAIPIPMSSEPSQPPNGLTPFSVVRSRSNRTAFSSYLASQTPITLLSAAMDPPEFTRAKRWKGFSKARFNPY